MEYICEKIGEIIYTKGLSEYLGREFAIKMRSKLDESYVKSVIDYITKNIVNGNKEVQNGESFACGSWLIKFTFNGNFIELHEFKELIENPVYEFDLSFSSFFLKSQIDQCESKGIIPSFPSLGQYLSVSPEIFGGSEVNGVRYDAPDHMTGWYLTSNSYSGDVKSLEITHLFHVMIKRPDLAKFFALPFGFRFFKDQKGENAWFDRGSGVD